MDSLIKELWDRGAPLDVLAERFGLTKVQVLRIIHWRSNFERTMRKVADR